MPSPKKYLDQDGLLYFWSKINGKFVIKETGKGLSHNDFTDTLKTKLDGIESGATATVIDSALSSTSENPVQNKKVYEALGNKVDKVNGKGLSTNDLTDALKASYDQAASDLASLTIPDSTSDLTNDSDFVSDANYVHTDNNFTSSLKTKLEGVATGAEVNVIEEVQVNGTALSVNQKKVNVVVPTDNASLANGAGYQTASDVSTAIAAAVSSVYKAKGSKTFATLPTLASTEEGNVYNVSDAFTTTSDFVEGAGKSYPAGTNVVCINTATTGTAVYKWDVLAGMIDLSNFVTFNDLSAITNAEIDTIVAS